VTFPMRITHCAVLVVVALFSTSALAQAFISHAPYVPTPQSTVDRMLELARVSADDYLIDLGSGDGRIVITAATKYGTRGMGIEIENNLVNLSQYTARRAGVADRVRFVTQDLFTTDLRPATVLTLYLFHELNLKLRPRILEQLRPGARVVTHDWDMGEWEPDVAETIPAPDKPVGIIRTSKIFMWYVPAKLDGTWRFETPLAADSVVTAELSQRFQYFDGALQHGEVRFPITDGRAQGTAVQFRIGAGALAGDYVGTATGGEMAGEIRRDGTAVGTWKAIRK
jgi:Histone methylation protein DOT1